MRLCTILAILAVFAIASIAAEESRVFGSAEVSGNEISQLKEILRLVSVSACPPNVILAWGCTNVCPTAQVTNVAVFADEKEDALAYSATVHAKRTVYYVFRGSKTLTNWLNNIKFVLVPAGMHWTEIDDVDDLETCDDESMHPNEILIHRGFLKTFIAIKAALMRHVVGTAGEMGYDVVFLGHSLGGALAAIAAYFASLILPRPRISLYTVNNPRIGNSRFVGHLHAARFAKMVRVVNRNDFASKLPPRWIGYRHTSREIFITPDGKTVFCDDVSPNGEFLGEGNSYYTLNAQS